MRAVVFITASIDALLASSTQRADVQLWMCKMKRGSAVQCSYSAVSAVGLTSLLSSVFNRLTVYSRTFKPLLVPGGSALRSGSLIDWYRSVKGSSGLTGVS